MPKSLEALSVLPTPDQYPDPPIDMGPEQADEWRLIVRRMPPDWFTAERWPVLRQLVQHTYTSKVVHNRIVEFHAGLTEDKSTQELDRLSRMQDREGKAIGRFSKQLRLTPQSQRHAGNNSNPISTAIKNATPTPPWEARGRA